MIPTSCDLCCIILLNICVFFIASTTICPCLIQKIKDSDNNIINLNIYVLLASNNNPQRVNIGMYKVSHTSMPRPALVYNGHRSVTRCELNEKKALNHYLIEDVPYKNKMQLPLPIFSKKPPQRSTPPVSKHVDSEAVSRLRNSWHDFSHTKDGRPDKSIVHYRATKEMPKDFVAFDVEKYLTERLLRAVNLDPRIVNGF